MAKQQDELFTHLLALGKLIRARLNRGEVLPMSQLETLYLAHARNPSMHDVARYHRITAPSATAHVRELVQQGYLTRVADEKDRRHVLLSITPAGRRALKRALSRRMRIFQELCKGLSENDKAAFDRILTKILSNQTI